MDEVGSTFIPGPEAGVVFVMEVADRPGIVHAIAAVFAHRGLSMSTLVTDTHHKPSRILVQFRGTQRQAKMVERVLARLHDVQTLRRLDENADEVREIAIFRAEVPLPPIHGVEVQASGDRYVIIGPRALVESALVRFAREAGITDVSRSLLVP